MASKKSTRRKPAPRRSAPPQRRDAPPAAPPAPGTPPAPGRAAPQTRGGDAPPANAPTRTGNGGLADQIMGQLGAMEARINDNMRGVVESVVEEMFPEDDRAAGNPAPATPDADAADNAEVRQLRIQITELQERLDHFEMGGQVPERRDGQGLPGLGSTIWDSEVFQAWRSNNFGGTMPGEGKGVDIPSQLARSLSEIVGQHRSSDAISSTQLGNLILPTYRPGIVSELLEATDIASLIPYTGISGINYEFNKETAASQFGYLQSVVTGAPTHPTTFATVAHPGGWVVGSKVRFHTSAGIKFSTISAVDEDTGVLTFSANIDSNVALGDRVTAEHYGATGESKLKPYGFLEVERKTITTKVIAILKAVTEQMLQSIGGLQSLIQQHMLFGARRNLDWHYLYGDGSTTQLSGFFSEDDKQSILWSTQVSGTNRLDLLFLAALMINVPDNVMLTIVMNRRDWDQIVRLKSSSTGQYIFNVATGFGPVQVVNLPGMRTINDMRVVFSGAVKDGDFMIADFAQASTRIDSGMSRFATGWVNDQFAHNELTARLEDRLEHAILRTSAYVTGQWDSAPA